MVTWPALVLPMVPVPRVVVRVRLSAGQVFVGFSHADQPSSARLNQINNDQRAARMIRVAAVACVRYRTRSRARQFRAAAPLPGCGRGICRAGIYQSMSITLIAVPLYALTWPWWR
jgi:hypothetical protein